MYAVVLSAQVCINKRVILSDELINLTKFSSTFANRLCCKNTLRHFIAKHKHNSSKKSDINLQCYPTRPHTDMYICAFGCPIK